MSADSHSNKLPDWVMILIFSLMVITLWVLGDTFVGITGTLLLIKIFSGGYNKAHLDEH